MVLTTATLLLLVLVMSAPAEAQSIVISRAATRSITTASLDTFTGTARIERLFEAADPSHATGGIVSFERGARTAWHIHPRGQTLIVTSGVGLVQVWGDAVDEVRSGDVVRIPAGRKHWHGASRTSPMTHIAIAEHRDGSVVEWMEHVTDEQYGAPVRAAAPQTTSAPVPTRPSGVLQPRVAPGMADLTDDVLFGDVWLRTELSPRDRSLVTISVLIATGKSGQLTGHLNRALDNGVQPIEASGLLTHLAVYAGWPNAVSALEVYEQVYAARKVDTSSLRPTGPRAQTLASDPERARAWAERFAPAPKFVELTNQIVFDDIWRRADLLPRDRSLVTISALAALGDHDQLDVYVRRGIETGLTRDQINEALTHLGFYAGWGKATKALAVVNTRTAN